jgi:hypothetical protein
VAEGILKHRPDMEFSFNETDSDKLKENDHDTTVTPPSTPTKVSFLDDDKYGKTPQIAAELFQRFLIILLLNYILY